MKTIEKSIEILNDLIEINNDRVAGFAHAAQELKERDLERGEDAIKKAYQAALSAKSGLAPEFTGVVMRQQQRVIEAHNQVKALRDGED